VTRILIADDHDVVRDGLRRLLEAQPNCEVVAEAPDGKEAILKAVETNPDIAVVDYSLPLINGIEVTRQIRSRLPKTEVLIFTMHDNEALIEELLRAGAKGFVLKSEAKAELFAAIESLANHRLFFTSKVSEALLDLFKKPEHHKSLLLTRRERQIVQLIAEGHTNRRVAAILNISLKTVETHRAVCRRLRRSFAMPSATSSWRHEQFAGGCVTPRASGQSSGGSGTSEQVCPIWRNGSRRNDGLCVSSVEQKGNPTMAAEEACGWRVSRTLHLEPTPTGATARASLS
jgi:DNA-binding NarL/FixJ family response regulator